MWTFRLNSSTVKLSINYNEHLSPAEEIVGVCAPLCVRPALKASWVCLRCDDSNTNNNNNNAPPKNREGEEGGAKSPHEWVVPSFRLVEQIPADHRSNPTNDGGADGGGRRDKLNRKRKNRQRGTDQQTLRDLRPRSVSNPIHFFKRDRGALTYLFTTSLQSCTQAQPRIRFPYRASLILTPAIRRHD